MYSLTLTAPERQAFDWVANRYAAGDIKKLLCSSCNIVAVIHDNIPNTNLINDDDRFSWNCTNPVCFNIPEHVAWQIRDLAEQERFSFPCFAPELKAKMIKFCDSIV